MDEYLGFFIFIVGDSRFNLYNNKNTETNTETSRVISYKNNNNPVNVKQRSVKKEGLEKYIGSMGRK